MVAKGTCRRVEWSDGIVYGTQVIDDGATIPREASDLAGRRENPKVVLSCSCCLKLDRVGLVIERLLTGSGAIII